MICKNCGAPLQENAAFCGNCGMKVEAQQPVYEQPVYEEPACEAGEYKSETYTNYQEQGSYTSPVQPVYEEPAPSAPFYGEKPNTILWIVLSAIQTFTCCQVTGIISLILSILGHVAADKGDFADAAKKIKYAKISFWVGIALFVVFVVVYALFLLVFSSAMVGAGDVLSEFYYY